MGRALIRISSILAFIAIVAAGCNSTGCLDNGSAIPLAGFYSSVTGASVTVDSLEIYGVGAPGDSALIAPSASESQVYLPMRADHTSTQWVIAYRAKNLNYSELYDTLSFVYEAIPYFASEDCGAMYSYRVESLVCTDHLIDSVKLVDPLITNVDRESVKIFFRTSAEEEQPQ